MGEELVLRQQVAERYVQLLNEVGINTTPYVELHNTSAWAQFTIRLQDRDAVQEKLKQAGIPTAVHYPIPLNWQPAVADASAHLPVGDEVAVQVLSLPIGADLSEADQYRISEMIASIQTKSN